MVDLDVSEKGRGEYSRSSSQCTDETRADWREADTCEGEAVRNEHNRSGLFCKFSLHIDTCPTRFRDIHMKSHAKNVFRLRENKNNALIKDIYTVQLVLKYFVFKLQLHR